MLQYIKKSIALTVVGTTHCSMKMTHEAVFLTPDLQFILLVIHLLAVISLCYWF